MCEAGWEALNWLVELVAKSELYNRGRESIYRLIERVSEGEVREGGGKVIYRLVEVGAEDEVGDEGGKVLGRVVEPRVEDNVGDKDGEGIEGLLAAHHAAWGIVLEETSIITIWRVAERILTRYIRIFKEKIRGKKVGG